MSSKNQTKKKERGTSHKYLANANGTDFSTILWKDSKIVILDFTFVGQLSEDEHFHKEANRNIKIPCQNVVKKYNRHIDGFWIV